MGASRSRGPPCSPGGGCSGCVPLKALGLSRQSGEENISLQLRPLGWLIIISPGLPGAFIHEYLQSAFRFRRQAPRAWARSGGLQPPPARWPWPVGTAPTESRGAEPGGAAVATEKLCLGRAGLWRCWIPLPSSVNCAQSSPVGESGGRRGRWMAGSRCK